MWHEGHVYKEKSHINGRMLFFAGIWVIVLFVLQLWVTLLKLKPVYTSIQHLHRMSHLLGKKQAKSLYLEIIKSRRCQIIMQRHT